MKLIRYLLFPVVPIYFLVTWFRNKCYDVGIFKSTEYDIATICVGNLSVGGTGKTPMIEYLIRLLKEDFNLATLSRGYKRESSGFVIADASATASSIGDEPFQFYNKFDDIIVSVDADRQNAISKLTYLNTPPQIILLDDAFQHRKVKAKFNLLLTAYDDLYTNDIMLPTGNLREPRSAAKRANAIVVTKCPEPLSEIGKQKIIEAIHPKEYQPIFFSSIVYSNVINNSFEDKPLDYLNDKKFTLVTGIANSKQLVNYLKAKQLDFDHLNFNDHHVFAENEIQVLKNKDLILTTEKDYMRLQPHFKEQRNLFYLPIKLKIDRPKQFEDFLKSSLIQKA